MILVANLPDGIRTRVYRQDPFSSFCGSRPQLRRLIRTLGPLNTRSLSPNEHASRPPARPGQPDHLVLVLSALPSYANNVHNDAVCVRQQPLTLCFPKLGRRFSQPRLANLDAGGT